MHKNIFKSIINKSKNSNDLMLIQENKTYNDLYLNIKKIYYFLKKNVNQKEKICICLNYSFDFISLIFSSYLNKNPITFINPTASLTEKRHVIKDSGSKLVIFEKKNLNLNSNKKFSTFNYIILKKKKTKKKNFRLLIYTSGTTARSKGVMISTNAITSNVLSINHDVNIKKKDIGIIFSPPAYAMGISQILSFLESKSKFVIYKYGLKFPFELKEQIKKNKVTILNISISAFRILKSILKEKEVFNSVKVVMAGGMQFTITEYKQYKKIFPKARLIIFYGCTENSPRISHYHVKTNKNFKGILPVGQALKGVKIKIKKEKNSKIGKIFISGKSLMNGYLNLDLINKKKLKNNWFDTGDIGFFDIRKDLYLIGRSDNTFRVGHEKLCPEELESEIKTKLNLENVIISKTKDRILDWVPVCVLKLSEKPKIKKDILLFLRKNFSSYKIPKKIIFIKNFPKTNYGKVDRLQIEKIVKKYND